MVLVDILIIAPNYLATLESEREGQVENVDLFMETPLKILVFSIYSPLPLYVLERESPCSAAALRVCRVNSSRTLIGSRF